MKKKKLKKLIAEEVRKQVGSFLEQTEAVGKTVETEPTVLVEGEVYRDVYKTGRIVKDNGYEVYSLCDVLTIDGKIFNQDTTGNTWTDGVTKLTPEEEEAYLIEVAGHRGLKEGVAFKEDESINSDIYTVMYPLDFSDGSLYGHDGCVLYDFDTNTWATPEPVVKDNLTTETEEKVVEYSHFAIVDSCGVYVTTKERSNHKITKYANEETPVIEKL